MRRLSLTQKFFLLLLIALPLFGYFLGKVITSSMHTNMLNRSNEMAANFVTHEIRNKLHVDDFIILKEGEEYQNLSTQVESLHLGPDVMGVKIWNRDFTVVWSSNEEDVGESSPGHHELVHVYEGELISEISDEHHLEEKYTHSGAAVGVAYKIMELYIPVRSNPEGEVKLAVEVYRNIDQLLAEIGHHNKIVWLSIATGTFLLYLLLFGLIWGAARQIDKQDIEIKSSEERFRNLIHSAQDGIVSADRSGRIFLINQAAEKIFGYEKDELHNLSFIQLFKNDGNSDFADEISNFVESGDKVTTGKSYELLGMHKSGQTLPLEVSLSVSGDQDSMMLTGIIRDITDKKHAEEQHEKLQTQLIQMQKMETVGRLAGGIAHDFNNILSAIIGYSELLLSDLPDDSQAYQDVETIKNSGEKAALLTGQLLAFSRKQVLKMQPVDLNAVIEGMVKIINRLIGENINLELDLIPGISSINADQGQLEQIILNLAVNARDAMPNGGNLLIETNEAQLEKEYVDYHPDAKLGRHVLLILSDTGVGMDDHVKQQIFDPFFTTKERGKGTGLGLSTVYGIVKQHESQIYVYSEPGMGTTFKLFFPVSEYAAGEDSKTAETVLPKGNETILIAEDDDTIIRMLKNYLEPLGYNLLLANDGLEAMDLSHSYEAEIHILLTDVIMPKMNGQELADSIQKERPDIKVVFMSGYTDDVIKHHGVLEPGINFIQKPITPSKLTQVLKDVLEIK
jgi:PAS domain S-box-containing protein